MPLVPDVVDPPEPVEAVLVDAVPVPVEPVPVDEVAAVAPDDVVCVVDGAVVVVAGATLGVDSGVVSGTRGSWLVWAGGAMPCWCALATIRDGVSSLAAAMTACRCADCSADSVDWTADNRT